MGAQRDQIATFEILFRSRPPMLLMVGYAGKYGTHLLETAVTRASEDERDPIVGVTLTRLEAS